MVRIPNEDIERLKQDISLMRLVESSGVELKKHDKDYLGQIYPWRLRFRSNCTPYFLHGCVEIPCNRTTITRHFPSPKSAYCRLRVPTFGGAMKKI